MYLCPHGCVATLLLLCHPLLGCDRDGFRGLIRIDRLKQAQLILYGELGVYAGHLPSPHALRLNLQFTIYCVVRNSYQNSALDLLLRNTTLELTDVYTMQDCVSEWYLLNGKVYDSLSLELRLVTFLLVHVGPCTVDARPRPKLQFAQVWFRLCGVRVEFRVIAPMRPFA